MAKNNKDLVMKRALDEIIAERMGASQQQKEPSAPQYKGGSSSGSVDQYTQSLRPEKGRESEGYATALAPLIDRPIEGTAAGWNSVPSDSPDKFFLHPEKVAYEGQRTKKNAEQAFDKIVQGGETFWEGLNWNKNREGLLKGYDPEGIKEELLATGGTLSSMLQKLAAGTLDIGMGTVGAAMSGMPMLPDIAEKVVAGFGGALGGVSEGSAETAIRVGTEFMSDLGMDVTQEEAVSTPEAQSIIEGAALLTPAEMVRTTKGFLTKSKKPTIQKGKVGIEPDDADYKNIITETDVPSSAVDAIMQSVKPVEKGRSTSKIRQNIARGLDEVNKAFDDPNLAPELVPFDSVGKPIPNQRGKVFNNVAEIFQYNIKKITENLNQKNKQMKAVKGKEGGRYNMYDLYTDLKEKRNKYYNNKDLREYFESLLSDFEKGTIGKDFVISPEKTVKTPSKSVPTGIFDKNGNPIMKTVDGGTKTIPAETIKKGTPVKIDIESMTPEMIDSGFAIIEYKGQKYKVKIEDITSPTGNSPFIAPDYRTLLDMDSSYKSMYSFQDPFRKVKDKETFGARKKIGDTLKEIMPEEYTINNQKMYDLIEFYDDLGHFDTTYQKMNDPVLRNMQAAEGAIEVSKGIARTSTGAPGIANMLGGSMRFIYSMASKILSDRMYKLQKAIEETTGQKIRTTNLDKTRGFVKDNAAKTRFYQESEEEAKDIDQFIFPETDERQY